MTNVTGVNEVRENLSNLSKNLQKGASDTVRIVAERVRGAVIKSLQEVSQGGTVKRQKQGGIGTYDHTVSKKGDAPNTDTGNLVRKIAVEHEEGETVSYVGTSVKYGPWLEFGTKHMDARPWLRPALRKEAKGLKSELATQTRKQIRRSGE